MKKAVDSPGIGQDRGANDEVWLLPHEEGATKSLANPRRTPKGRFPKGCISALLVVDGA